MDALLVRRRFEGARKYLKFLSSIESSTSWGEGYERYLSGGLSLPEAAALVHPCHYRHLVSVKTILGQPSFSERDSAEWCQCQSEDVWGYECPLDVDQYEADHLFPWAAGGPTAVENRIWLCSFHNQSKSSDVHLYRWEGPEPKWIGGRLGAIAAVLLPR